MLKDISPALQIPFRNKLGWCPKRQLFHFGFIPQGMKNSDFALIFIITLFFIYVVVTIYSSNNRSSTNPYRQNFH